MGEIEISHHECNIYGIFVASRGRWLTVKEIAAEAGVAARTARMHCRRFTELGILQGLASCKSPKCFQATAFGSPNRETRIICGGSIMHARYSVWPSRRGDR
jgi:hypothetical protein